MTTPLALTAAPAAAPAAFTTSSSSDGSTATGSTIDVTEFLHYTLDDFQKKGPPKDILKLLDDAFAQEIATLSKTASLSAFCENMNAFREEISYVFANFPHILKKGYKSFDGRKMRKFSSTDALPHILLRFVSLHSLFRTYAPTHGLQLLSKHVIHLLISAHVEKSGLGSVIFFPVQDDFGMSTEVRRQLFCVKDADQWTAHFRSLEEGQNTNHFLLQLAPGRAVLIDDNFQPITDRCLSATFGTDTTHPETQKMYFECVAAKKKLKTYKVTKDFVISFNFTYYTGLPSSSGQNAFVFKGFLKTDGKYFIVKPKGMDASLAAHAEQQIAAYIDVVKPDVIKKVCADMTDAPSYLLRLPNSGRELRELEVRLLEELAKDPEANAPAIEYLIEVSGITLPALDSASDEGAAAAAEDVATITAQEGLKLLCENLSADEATSAIDARLVLEDAARKKQAAADSEKKEMPSKKDNAAPQQKTDFKEKKETKKMVASDKPRLILTSDERSKVRHIMKGHAMKGPEFVKFGLALLNRKVKLKKPNVVGSHINVGQQTLVRIHRNGRKDIQGVVSHQKSFLRELLHG